MEECRWRSGGERSEVMVGCEWEREREGKRGREREGGKEREGEGERTKS